MYALVCSLSFNLPCFFTMLVLTPPIARWDKQNQDQQKGYRECCQHDIEKECEVSHFYITKMVDEDPNLHEACTQTIEGYVSHLPSRIMIASPIYFFDYKVFPFTISLSIQIQIRQSTKQFPIDYFSTMSILDMVVIMVSC